MHATLEREATAVHPTSHLSACHPTWVSAQLFEELVGLHQVDEALETLALLVHLLVLAPMQQLLLDFVKQLVPIGSQVGIMMLVEGVLAILAIVLLLDQ